MAHVNANTHAHSNRQWRTAHAPQRRFGWDIALLLAITLVLVFMATNVGGALLSRVAGMLNQNYFLTQTPPLPRPIDQSNLSDLIVALKDSIPNTRVNAAEALGSTHDLAATDALIAATFDSNVRVREEAATALGDLGAIQALPRLRELQVFPINPYVAHTAFEAEGKIKNEVAAALGVPRSSVEALTVGQNGTAYVAVLKEFYTLKNGQWQHIAELPVSPNDLAVGPDGRLLFMSTVVSGLYRSQDGGYTWEHVQYGLQTPTQLRTTAVVLDPINGNQIYAAVAFNGSTTDLLNPLGIVSSNDSGKTWLMLEDSPHESVTTLLIVDRSTHQFLYGMSDTGPWVYRLPADLAGSTQLGK